jgi:membrane protease YdiL (CAAX protease family)
MLEHSELQTSYTLGAPPTSPESRPRSATLFLLAVFGSTWLFQLPALLVDRGTLPGPRERFMPLVVLGFFAPAIFAVALSALEGRAARRELWRPLTLWRVHPGWYAAALGLPCAIFVAMRALAAAVGGSELGPWLYPPAQPQQLAAMLIIPFTEQIPWRGYVYPRLQRAHGAQLASLLTGFAWSLFHVQKHAFIDPNATLTVALLTLAFMTSGTIVFSWIYLRTGGSLLLVVLANAGAYLNNPTTALPNTLPLALHTAGFCSCALALLLFDRSAWRRDTSAGG